MSQAISISPMVVNETAFVAKALKEGLRHSDIKIGPEEDAKTFSQMSNWEAYRVVNPLINDLLTKANVLVARRGSRALGFVVYQCVDDVALVHVYVRAGDPKRGIPSERQKGVGKTLLLEALDHIPTTAALESYFPSARWAEKASSYGFYCPEYV